MPTASKRTRRVQARKSQSAKARPRIESEKSAGAIVFYRGKRTEYLLIHATYWEFPKGRIDADESERAAAVREVREESGLDVQLLDGFREEVNYFYRRRETGLLVRKQVVYFVGEATTQAVNLSWEHQQSQWLSYEAALEQLKYSNARALLEKAHAVVQAQK